MKRFLALALCALVAGQAGARTLYVDASRPHNNGNGLSLKKAKKTLQAAINVAKKGDTILVYPGAYAPIKTKNRKIAIKAVKGATGASITAQYGVKHFADLGKPKKTHPSSLAYSVGRKTVLVGFGLNGAAYTGDDYAGRPIQGGTLKNCYISGFSAANYGLASESSFRKCDIAGNCNMCGMVECKLELCRVWNNLASDAGGFSKCRLVNCLVVHNHFGGARALFHSSFLNCTITDNLFHGHDRTSLGSSVSASVVRKCSSLAERTSFRNCILWNNKRKIFENTVASQHTQRYSVGYSTWYSYEDRYKPATVHNVDSGMGNKYVNTYKDNRAPKFVYETISPCDFNTSAGIQSKVVSNGYRLQAVSPCIDKGKLTKTQKKQVGAKDLAGGKRIRGKAVDMGCFEF